VVLRRAVDDLALRRDDEEHVEEPFLHHLGPARLGLDDDVRVVEPGQRREPLRLRTRNVDEEIARRDHVRDVEDLVREAGQRAFCERDQLHGHVDPDDRDGRMDAVLDDPEVPLDVLPAADAVNDRRQPDRHVRRNGRWPRCAPVAALLILHLPLLPRFA
jgi:hypothetical protein